MGTLGHRFESCHPAKVGCSSDGRVKVKRKFSLRLSPSFPLKVAIMKVTSFAAWRNSSNTIERRAHNPEVDKHFHKTFSFMLFKILRVAKFEILLSSTLRFPAINYQMGNLLNGEIHGASSQVDFLS